MDCGCWAQHTQGVLFMQTSIGMELSRVVQFAVCAKYSGALPEKGCIPLLEIGSVEPSQVCSKALVPCPCLFASRPRGRQS